MSAKNDAGARKPQLTGIFVDDFRGIKTIRLDFDNDRHHASQPIAGDRDAVSMALYDWRCSSKNDALLTARATPEERG